MTAGTNIYDSIDYWALLLVAAGGRAQIADWPKVLHDLANGQDRPTQEAAEKLLSGTLFPVRLQDPAIIGKLRQLLSDKDRSVVLGAIVALDHAGSAAAPARAELERFQQDLSDPELAKAAASVIAKIDRH